MTRPWCVASNRLSPSMRHVVHKRVKCGLCGRNTIVVNGRIRRHRVR